MVTQVQESIRHCKNNRERVLTYIKRHGSITPLRAFSEWSETRLATYVQNLRDEGWGIDSAIRVSDSKKRYTEYSFSITQRRVDSPLYVEGGMPFYQRQPIFVGPGDAAA